MAIRSRFSTVNLEIISQNFHVPMPAGIRVNGLDILWAAITVGHRNPLFWKWYQDDIFGYEDLKSREHFVYANLDLSDFSKIQHSNWFNNSDATEKRFANYRIGIMFMKLVTHNLLNIPWLAHYSWMEKDGLTSVQGKSEPDLLGYNSLTGEWISIEAKGRLAKLSPKEMQAALNQAAQVKYVDNTPVTKCLAGGTYRSGSRIKFLWEDPESKGEIKLKTSANIIRNYYAGAFKLYELQEKEILGAAFEFRIKLSSGLKEVRAMLNSSKDEPFEYFKKSLENIQREATPQISERDEMKRTFLDGITLVRG